MEVGLEALNSADRERGVGSRIMNFRPADRPPMNLTEKIFAMHDVDSKGYVRVGDTIRVAVDWIMASEASWGVSRPERGSSLDHET